MLFVLNFWGGGCEWCVGWIFGSDSTCCRICGVFDIFNFFDRSVCSYSFFEGRDDRSDSWVALLPHLRWFMWCEVVVLSFEISGWIKLLGIERWLVCVIIVLLKFLKVKGMMFFVLDIWYCCFSKWTVIVFFAIEWFFLGEMNFTAQAISIYSSYKFRCIFFINFQLFSHENIPLFK